MLPLLYLALVFQTPAPASGANVLDRIAVVVGTNVITESEVLQEVRLAAFLNQTPLALTPDARRTAADRLVDQQLIRTEMRVGAYPEPTPAEVDAMLQSLKAERFGNSETDLRAALDRYGITEQQLRAHLRWQLAAIRFTDIRFAAASAEAQSANRDGASSAVTGVDQQLDAWLKQTRAATKVQFKPGAFQ